MKIYGQDGVDSEVQARKVAKVYKSSFLFLSFKS